MLLMGAWIVSVAMRHLFENRDFARLFAGRVVTNVGDSLYAVAAMWLVYSLTGSTAYTGIAGFLTMGPQALQVFFGPLVDRFPLRRVLVGTQLVQAVLVLSVPAAHLLGVLSVELVLVVMPLLSLLNQFVYPAQTAALPRLVDREDLTAANSLFSLAYQGVDMAFNGLAGVLIALVGAVALYAIDSITFLVAVACFLGVRVPPAERGVSGADEQSGAVAADGGESSYLADLKGGLRFVRHTPLLYFFGAGFVANALLGATFAVLPAFADARGEAGTYGFLLAALSAGMLVGALAANRVDRVPYGRLSIAGFGLSAALWFGALLCPWTLGTVVLYGLAAVPIGATNVVGASLVQRLVPDDLLGRVSAASGSASTAIMPLGTLLGGLAGDAFSATAVMWVGGLGFLWIVLYVAAVPTLRRMPAPVDATPYDRPTGV